MTWVKDTGYDDIKENGSRIPARNYTYVVEKKGANQINITGNYFNFTAHNLGLGVVRKH